MCDLDQVLGDQVSLCMKRLASALLCIAATASCSCAGLPPAPDQGGPAWLRLESEHFVLYTDLGEPKARDAILTFERLLDAYTQLGWETTGKLPVKLDVVLFADRSDFEVFAGKAGGFHARLMPFEPLVVLP